MLEDGLSYPFRGDWIGRIIIGGVLAFFSFLIFPAIFLSGYLYDVLQATIEGEDAPPDFENWGEMFVHGIGVTVIGIAYSIVPVGLYFIVVTVFLGAGGAVGGEAGGILAGLGIVATILLIPVLLFVYYIIPAAIANYAHKEELKAGFEVSTIKTVVLSKEYLVAILLPIVIAIVLWIASIILAITIIGLLFFPFLQFYGEVAIFRMFGSAFNNVQVG